MYRKITILILSCLMILTAASCGGKNEPSVITGADETKNALPLTSAAQTTAAAAIEAGPLQESELKLTLDGSEYAPGMDVTQAAETLFGGPSIREQGKTCIGGGCDVNYYYHGQSICLYTLGGSGAQVVYDIYVTESGFTGIRGLVIGVSDRTEVLEKLGTPDAELLSAVKYSCETGALQLTLEFKDSILSAMDLCDPSMY